MKLSDLATQFSTLLLNTTLNYFVGFTPLKSRLWAEIDSHPDFGQIKAIEPATALPALLPANDTTFDSDDEEDMPPY